MLHYKDEIKFFYTEQADRMTEGWGYFTDHNWGDGVGWGVGLIFLMKYERNEGLT